MPALIAVVLAAQATAASPLRPLAVTTPAVACAIDQVQACGNTNALVWRPGFARAVRRFLGRHAGDSVGYLRLGPLAPQVEDVLGGPPDEPRRMPDGGLLFTACRAHSCTEKGAIAFDRASRVTAIAIVSFHCGTLPKTCSKDPFLDVYDGNAAASAPARAAIVAWAGKATAADAAVFHYRPIAAPTRHVVAATGG